MSFLFPTYSKKSIPNLCRVRWPRLRPDSTAHILRRTPSITPSRLEKFQDRWSSNVSSYQRNSMQGSSKIGVILIVLASSGYLIYRYPFNAPQPLPASLDRLLRLALHAEYEKDYRESERIFEKSYDLSLKMVDQKTEGVQMDWMKTTGVGIRWAGLLENIGQLEKAANVYEKVYKDLDQAARQKNLNRSEILRRVQLAQKLAELYQAINTLPDRSLADQQALNSKIEHYLTTSLEEMLRLVKRSPETAHERSNLDKGLEEPDLPTWIKKSDLGGCLESLAEFYARNGNVNFALPLYLSAINIILPPKVPKSHSTPTDQDRCHAAMLMNNLSQLLTQATLAAENQSNPRVSDATAWANKSFDISQSVLAKVPQNLAAIRENSLTECLSVKLVSRHNMASLAEMRGEKALAKKLYAETKAEAELHGIPLPIALAEQGFKRN
ncbi:hypothetical protein O181_047207 [Austropuccinia psidii MF-1]|uniref:Uncharacterized protein n=1 Tax=Austropuccinia psidii MF-1 TaxID=1389203 RepID=A0A9Q3HKE5_9BASI|nr:hypothetical protein [Austropuccinia psidii MF-1]